MEIVTRRKFTELMVLGIGLALATLGVDCFAIIGGRDVGPDEFPANSAVMIFNMSETSPELCSGALVAPDLVLTALHCLANGQQRIDGTPPSKLVVYFGGSTGPFSSLDPSRFAKVVDFRKSDSNAKSIFELAFDDLLLLKLENPAIARFTAAPLLSDSRLLSAGMSIYIAGFGTSKLPMPTEPPSHIHLLKTFETGIQRIDGNWIILKSTDGGLSGGDSGGPAYISINGHSYLIGVASSYIYEQNQSLAEYSSIPRKIDWILTAAKSMGSPIR